MGQWMLDTSEEAFIEHLLSSQPGAGAGRLERALEMKK